MRPWPAGEGLKKEGLGQAKLRLRSLMHVLYI